MVWFLLAGSAAPISNYRLPRNPLCREWSPHLTVHLGTIAFWELKLPSNSHVRRVPSVTRQVSAAPRNASLAPVANSVPTQVNHGHEDFRLQSKHAYLKVRSTKIRFNWRKKIASFTSRGAE